MSAILDLQARIGEINTANGWRTTDEAALEPKARVNAQITRLALITTEVAEAIEEIRNGRPVDETYYLYEDGSPAVARGNRPASVDPMDRPRKPEGVPSELADIVIRALDAADAWGIDLGAVIEEKLAFNALRGYRHGGKTA